ncbi:hypothetical protein [Helicobacter typhlonius]
MSYKHSKASCKHFKKETQNEYNNSGSSKYWGGGNSHISLIAMGRISSSI